ncbi:MAG: hypothetical protein KDD21_10300 [Bacteroidetes bacterium]|nr:hypothetical protein [Bacteroidota bacterium]
MLLTFTKPQFKCLIKEGVKQHTIREDKNNRWKVGTKIHFWLGNPRNTRGKNKPHQFGTGICSRLETIRMDFAIPEDGQTDEVKIGNDIILKTYDELNALAVNDGFQNWGQMKLWFDNENKMFVGKMIFWKDCVWS